MFMWYNMYKMFIYITKYKRNNIININKKRERKRI